MAERQLNGVLTRIRSQAAARDRSAFSDRDLLNQFINRCDEAAITALVERHGPMVLSICRRVLGNAHDAEDASQAVFLVLVRKAASIRKKESLASWLHGVAYHVAANRKRDLARRQAREAAVAKAPSEKHADDLSWRELRLVLDEELARLPHRLRAPLVLCYLEGKTRDEAAKQLDWTLGTLRGRLDRGRQLLCARLTRRGITLSAAMLASYLGADAASAGMPPRLVSSMIEALMAARLGVAAAPGAISSQAAALAEGALRSMSLSKLKIAALVSVLLSGIGVALLVRGMLQPDKQATGQPPQARNQGPEPPADAKSEKKPAEDPTQPIRTLVGHGDRVTSISCSADGRWIATAGWDGAVRLWDAHSGKEIRRLDVPAPRDYNPAHLSRVLFSPDGKFIVASQQAMPNETGVFVWNRDNGKTVHEFQAGAGGLAISPNGRLVACGGFGVIRIHELASGKIIHEMRSQQSHIQSLAFSPDGKTLFSAGPLPRPPSPDGRERLGLMPAVLRVWDVASGKERRSVLDGLKMSPLTQNNVLSPDGRTFAVGASVISLREVATSSERARFSGHTNDVDAVEFSLDGRTLASGSMDGTVRLWDLRSGKEIGRLGKEVAKFAGRGWILAVAFSPDGRTLIAGGLDHTVQIWDISRVMNRQVELKERSLEKLETDWSALGGDSARAFVAMNHLTASPGHAIPFLEKHLLSLKPLDMARIEQLITDLGNAQFQTREKASKELAALGDLAAPVLRKALPGVLSPEVRQRLVSLLNRLEGVSHSPEILRQIRTVEALEIIGNPEARRLLDKLAAGQPEFRLTQEAKAASERLVKRTKGAR